MSLEDDTARGLVVEAGVLFVASLRKVKGKLTGGMRLFRVVDRGKS